MALIRGLFISVGQAVFDSVTLSPVFTVAGLLLSVLCWRGAMLHGPPSQDELEIKATPP